MFKLSLKTLGICLGLFFAGLFALLSYSFWKAGIPSYVTFLRYATWTPICLVLAACCWGWRQKNGPYLPFIKAVQFFFLAYIVYELGYALVTIVLYDALDKQLYFKALSYSLEQMRLQMIQQHLPDTQIQDTLANATKDKDTGVTAGQVLLGFGQGLLLDFVKSVLLAIVLQKKPPVDQTIVTVEETI